jgi:hypothetical protein
MTRDHQSCIEDREQRKVLRRRDKRENTKKFKEKPKSSLIDPIHFKAPMVGKTIFPSYTSDGHLTLPLDLHSS